MTPDDYKALRARLRRERVRFPDLESPIELMEPPIGIATTCTGDLAAVIGIVVTVAVLAYLFSRLPGALS